MNLTGTETDSGPSAYMVNALQNAPPTLIHLLPLIVIKSELRQLENLSPNFRTHEPNGYIKQT